MQLSAKFSPKRKQYLYDFLNTIPKHITMFVQLTNPEWYEETEFNDLIRILALNKIGLIIVDMADRILKTELTIHKAFIKYDVTNNEGKVQEWVEKIKEWAGQGLEEAYFFVQSENNNPRFIDALEEMEALLS